MTLDVFLTIFFLIFVIAAAIVVFQLLKFRGSQKTLLETTRHLGFTPGLPNGNFAHRIDALYQIPGESNRFEVQQACYKIQSDSLMVIFDLVETGGVDYSTCERQAVAVQSARLDLPHLVVIPRINRLLSAVIEHGLKSWGTQLRFPGQPALEKRYIIFSHEPARAQAFFTDRLADVLVHSQNLTLYMAADMFSLSEFHESNTLPDPDQLLLRIQFANDLLSRMAG